MLNRTMETNFPGFPQVGFLLTHNRQEGLTTVPVVRQSLALLCQLPGKTGVFLVRAGPDSAVWRPDLRWMVPIGLACGNSFINLAKIYWVPSMCQAVLKMRVYSSEKNIQKHLCMNGTSIVMREREKEETDKQISICQLTIRAMGKNQINGDFPGSAMVKTLCVHFRGHRFHSWSGI